MKKIILTAVFAALTVIGAFAQDREDNGRAYFEPAKNVRIGYAGVNNSSSNLGGGIDLGLNIFEFGVRPYESGCVSIGADFQLDVFKAKEGYYFLSAAHKTSLVPVTATYDVKRSNMQLLSFCFPLNFTQRFDKMAITVGASAKLNLNTDTFTRYKNSTGDYCTLTVEGIHTRRFSYDVHLAVTYDGFGFYGSYSPMNVFENGNGPAFGFFTVGAYVRIED